MESFTYEERLRRGFAKIDADLKFLMGSLKEVLQSLGENETAELLPWISALSDPQAGFPPNAARAFSIAFQLLNLVEENTAAQMRRINETKNGIASEHGLFGDCLAHAKEIGTPEDRLAESLEKTRVEPVLTAHPSEARRTSILNHYRTLYLLLVKRENPIWTPSEVFETEEQIRLTLERIWRTGDTIPAKPSLQNERASINHYLINVFPEVLRSLDQRLRMAWRDAGYDEGRLRLPTLTFGSWVGGDRDGHPFVTAQVTRETLLELRSLAIGLARRQLEELSPKLTVSSVLQRPPPELMSATRLSSLGRANVRYPDEAWRAFVDGLVEFLSTDSRENPLRPQELLSDLNLLKASLMKVGAERLAARDVAPVIRSLGSFGFHLAVLDIRQNSKVYEETMGELSSRLGLLAPGEFLNLDFEAREEFLIKLIEGPQVFEFDSSNLPEATREALDLFDILTEHVGRFGIDGIGSFVVSMTRHSSDLLVVQALARISGLFETLNGRMRIVPLFETIDDLEGASSIVQRYLSHPSVLETLGPDRLLEVMVGYSDSCKDGGIVASQWALRSAQEQIAEAAGKAGVRVRFFHGRGGTISRGAGPTHRFLAALPPTTVNFNIRVTEQGETIAQKYANLITATYNLELLVANAVRVSLAPPRQLESPDLREIYGKLSRNSRAAHTALVEHPHFMTFFRQATPIDLLEHSNIGSRPARRTAGRSLEDLRAIPWVFSWCQSRFFLPGWFGAGTALASLQESEFQKLAKSLPADSFLKYCWTNIETSLVSASAELMRLYSSLVEEQEVRDELLAIILGEYERTGEQIVRLTGVKLVSRRPRLEQTLGMRASALKVLHEQQVQQLRAWRKRGSPKEGAGELLQIVNAIAAGLRTTG